ASIAPPSAPETGTQRLLGDFEDSSAVYLCSLPMTFVVVRRCRGEDNENAELNREAQQVLLHSRIHTRALHCLKRDRGSGLSVYDSGSVSGSVFVSLSASVSQPHLVVTISRLRRRSANSWLSKLRAK